MYLTFSRSVARRLPRLSRATRQRSFSSKPPADKAPAQAAPEPAVTAASASGGSGGLRLLLVAGALLGPPGYIAYKLNYDQEDREFSDTIRGSVPMVYDLLGPGGGGGAGAPSKLKLPTAQKEEWRRIKMEVDDITNRFANIANRTQMQQEEAELSAAAAATAGGAEAGSKAEAGAVDRKKISAAVDEGKESGEEVVKSGDTSGKEASVIVEDSADSAALRGKISKVKGELQEMKNKVETAAKKKLKGLEEELSKDLEIVLAKDVASGDVEDLRRRVVQLVLELKDRHRWEALRIHELTKLQTEELLEKYEELLRKQGDTYEALIASECDKAAATEAERVRAQKDAELAAAEVQWKKRTQNELEEQRRSLHAQMDRFIQKEKDKVEKQAEEERKQRLAKLASLNKNIEQLETALSKKAEEDNLSKRLHIISVAMFDIIEEIKTSKPLGPEIERLREASGGDPVINKVLSALPERIVTVGVPSQQELEKRFTSVHDNCQKVALLPPEGGGVLQYALANVVQVLSLSERGMVKGEDAEAKLARAKYYVTEKHDLEGALKEFESLDESIKQSAGEWLVLAKERVAAEQAIKFLRAHVTSLALQSQD